MLYLCEGAPIGYVWWALPTRLRAAGVPIEDVTALAALLTVPWAVKFLWAPGVDALRSAGVPLRRSILGAQIAMAASLVPLLAVDLPDDFPWLVGALLVHAVCAATQDVAIDALAVSTLPVEERGGATGWMQAGMLVGRALFGGAALQVEAWVGPDVVILALIALLLTSCALVALARGEPPGPAPARAGALARGVRILGAVARQRSTWLGVTFAALGGAGMEAAGTVAGPMMVDRGLSEAEVGRFFAAPAVAAMAGGALVGGWLSDRSRRRRATAAMLVVMTAVLLGLAWTARASGPPAALVAALAGAYAMFGAFTAASYALYMDLTDPELGGTQFSSFMAAVNFAAVWAGWAVGRLVAAVDYPVALALLAVASLPALALLPLMHRR